ncbi:MAG: Holliday junction resolvase RuvX, partial [Maritimibacter sp.]
MIYEEISEFAAALSPGMALAGLDYGDKTIGVAVSDGMRQVATPLETIRRQKKFTQDATRLGEILANRHITALVL